MTTDNLDSLSDAELSEAFAVEVAGWKLVRHGDNPSPGWKGMWTHPNGTPIGFLPSFTTSADAVAPFLEKADWCAGNYLIKPGNYVEIVRAEAEPIYVVAPTFARAAAIALLRAKRAAP